MREEIRRDTNMSVMAFLRPSTINHLSEDQFAVVHPLDDVWEEKVDTSSLGRMAMTTSVQISLMALRGYLVNAMGGRWGLLRTVLSICNVPLINAL
jgi:hypothetical protein